MTAAGVENTGEGPPSANSASFHQKPFSPHGEEDEEKEERERSEAVGRRGSNVAENDKKSPHDTLAIENEQLWKPQRWWQSKGEGPAMPEWCRTLCATAIATMAPPARCRKDGGSPKSPPRVPPPTQTRHYAPFFPPAATPAPSPAHPDVPSRTQNLQAELFAGQYECIICKECIHRHQPVWHCAGGCYSVLHWTCIRAWCAFSQKEPSTEGGGGGNPPFRTGGMATFAGVSRGGHGGVPPPPPPLSNASSRTGDANTNAFCPVCRFPVEVQRLERYTCYCGKVTDPPLDPLLVVGSCGATCGKARGPYCPHPCPQRCHPGPCPPCERRRDISCFCGKCTTPPSKFAFAAAASSPSSPSPASNLRRVVPCGSPALHFSCASPCGQVLACGQHTCTLPCHDRDTAPCPPCDVWLEASCFCGKQHTMRSCTEVQHLLATLPAVSSPPTTTMAKETACFSCPDLCGHLKSCGHHRCRQPCHAGPCSPCHRAPSQQHFCPCGKVRLSSLRMERPVPPSSSSIMDHPDRDGGGEGGEEGDLPTTAIARQSCTDPIPTCGLPCEKPLSCGHVCWRTCHAEEEEEADSGDGGAVLSTAPPTPPSLSRVHSAEKWIGCGPCNEHLALPCRCGRHEVTIPCFCLSLPPSLWEQAARVLHFPLPQTLAPLLLPPPSQPSPSTTASPPAMEPASTGMRDGGGDASTTIPSPPEQSAPPPPPSHHADPLLASYALPPHCSEPCRKKLSCTKHICTEKCCTLKEHVCFKICAKKRGCGKHVCGALCHAGPCPACPQTTYTRQYCPCGKTWLEPPIVCGTPAPICRFPCPLPRACGHETLHPCHDTQTSSCPPCLVPVEKRCASHNEPAAYFLPCHRTNVVCGKKCHKWFSCCDTYCEKTCHPGPCPHVCYSGTTSYRSALLAAKKAGQP